MIAFPSQARIGAECATRYNRASFSSMPEIRVMALLQRRALLALLLTIGLALARPGHGASTAPVLLVVGDSISAGYGLPAGEGWVTLLADRLAKEGYRYDVVNASITGDTTAGGRARLPSLLARHKPAIVIVELGGNDALRGGNLNATRDNLDTMVAAAQALGAKVLIIGMQLPSNYGLPYVRQFEALFVDVAKARKVPVVPAFFTGFGDDLALFQNDRIHPTADAQPRLLANAWPVLLPLLHK
jgi:acyl-CoA thioesterase I